MITFDTGFPLFFHEELMIERPELILTGKEASHVANSRRLGPGDRICLTNGVGGLGTGTIKEITRHPLCLRVALEQCRTLPSPDTELVIASAIPKGERIKTLLDMATQLGMCTFQPLNFARSAVRHRPDMSDRWRRIVASAAKQCRQVYFPCINSPRSLPELVAEKTPDTFMIYGQPTGDSLSAAMQGIIRKPAKLVIIIGPEGGLNEAETQLLAAHNVAMIQLGSLILRTETAALALLAAANHWLSELQ